MAVPLGPLRLLVSVHLSRGETKQGCGGYIREEQDLPIVSEFRIFGFHSTDVI